MDNYYIYKTTNLNTNKYYIGQHKYNITGIDPDYYGSGTIINHSINKHGTSAFEVEIIENGLTTETVNDREIYWIAELSATNPEFGYNLNGGGDAFLGFWSEEHQKQHPEFYDFIKEQMSEAWTEERRKDRSKRNIEMWEDPEFREKTTNKIIETCNEAEYIAELSKRASEAWNDERRENQTKRMIEWWTEERKQDKSNLNIEMWKDPKYLKIMENLNIKRKKNKDIRYKKRKESKHQFILERRNIKKIILCEYEFRLFCKKYNYKYEQVAFKYGILGTKYYDGWKITKKFKLRKLKKKGNQNK